MAKAKPKKPCPMCADGECDFGNVQLENGVSINMAIITQGTPCIEAAVYVPDNEYPAEYGVEIDYCPFCGRRLDE